MNTVGIAWRNLGRNKRRTTLSVLAVAVAVALLTFSMSFQKGTYAQMVRNMVFAHTGNLQVQRQGYLEDNDLAKKLDHPAEILKLLDGLPHVTGIAPRVNAPALVSRRDRTFGALIIGIDPEREARTSRLAQTVREGEYMQAGDRDGVLVGRKLAENLGVKVGDEIVFLGQGAEGSIAAGKLIVRGLFEFGVSDFDRTTLAAPIDAIQDAFSMAGGVSEIACLLDEDRVRPEVEARVRALLAQHGFARAVVHGWPELMPGVEQSIRIDWTSGLIFYTVLVIVVGFGIANTFLMAFMERIREFGVLLALGMRPARLSFMVYAESMCLTASGLAAGLSLGLPITYAFQVHGINFGQTQALSQYGLEPVIHPQLSFTVLGWALGIVLVISLLAAVYPAWKASRLKPVEALRHA